MKYDKEKLEAALQRARNINNRVNAINQSMASIPVALEKQIKVMNQVEVVLERARSINQRVANSLSQYKVPHHSGIMVEQVEDVLAKARAINNRIATVEKSVSSYEVPVRPVKVMAQSVDSGELEEYEVLFTRKANFKKSN
ncbi:hypothetical protein [Priestia megaterium]|uniref:hypothetical protein n=1 Tax=Priestia megaterium TaxID=1404 RepID=UPI0030097477